MPFGAAIAYGVLTALFGIVLLAWPGKTILVLLAFFAASLFVTGIGQIVAAFGRGESGGLRALLVLSGALSILVGVLVLRSPLQTLAIVTILLGAWWIVSGVVQVANGISRPAHRGWNIAMGAISVIAGFVVMLNPAISLVTLIWVSAIWMIVFGILAVVLAVAARNRAKHLTAA